MPAYQQADTCISYLQAHSVTSNNQPLYHTVPCCTVLYCAVLYYTIPYHTILYHTVPYNMVLGLGRWPGEMVLPVYNRM